MRPAGVRGSARARIERCAASRVPGAAPAGMVGTPFLAHTAGVMGNRHALKVKEGWIVRAIFWALVIAAVSDAKSAS